MLNIRNCAYSRLADLFTKAPPRDPFESLVLRLGLTKASDFAQAGGGPVHH